jgi:hypothetical protein
VLRLVLRDVVLPLRDNFLSLNLNRHRSLSGNLLDRQQWSRSLSSELDALRNGKINIKAIAKPGRQIVGLSLAIALLIWDWRLSLATGTGVGMMIFVYGLQQRSWQLPLAQLQRLLQSPYKPLVLAGLSGGVATLTTYMATAIWQESPSPWLASGLILQGCGTLAVLILLTWLLLNRQHRQDQTHFDAIVADLTESDVLKRLIAVRQLSRFSREALLDSTHKRIVNEYFQLLLAQEQEVLVRDAVLDGLQQLRSLPESRPITEDPTLSTINPRYKPRPYRRKVRRHQP